MKNIFRNIMMVAFPLLLLALPITVQAKGMDTIKIGVSIGDIPVGGMTAEEAKAAVQEYIDSLKEVTVELQAIEDQTVTVTAGDLGISWGNQEVIQEALTLGASGNVIQRYKALKDLEHEQYKFDIALNFDMNAINTILIEKCTVYDQPAKDFVLEKKDGVLQVVPGQTGYVLDVETSIDNIYNYLMNDWDHGSCQIELAIEKDEPKGSSEELAKVKDVLGTFSTNYKTSGADRSANVTTGSSLINGATVYPEEEFSMMSLVAPFTAANGYRMAGSYLNGQVVDSLGGGICQVSTTLYNAVLLAELDVTERYNHSMIVNYVEPSADAAIAESAGKDFRFINNTGYPIYIEGKTTEDKNVIFTIYGVETRPSNRTIRYESKVNEVISPPGEVINVDASQPIGSVRVQGAYTGYKAELWKVVMVDGVETSREKVNKSTYKMVPRTATVGVATADPNAYNEIMAAIATNNIDHVKNVAAALQAQAPVPAAPPAEVPPAEVPPVVEQPAEQPQSETPQI